MACCDSPVSPTLKDLKDKVAPEALRDEVENFAARRLKRTDTHEEAKLPSKEDIAEEKCHIAKDQVGEELENFNRRSLKPADTEVKDIMNQPDQIQQAIVQEKTEKIREELITSDPRAQLKHTKTEEKVHLPTKDELAAEKCAHGQK